MATHNQSLEVVVADGRRPVVIPGARIFRLAVPFLYAAVGISLGTLAGIAFAFYSTPAGASRISIDSIKGNFTGSYSATTPDAASDPKPANHPAAVAQVADTGKSATDARNSAAREPAPVTQKANRAVKVERSTDRHSSPGKTPAVGKSPRTRMAPDQHHPARPAAHPLVKPALTVLAISPEAEPVPIPLADEQLSLDDEARPSNFYSEGDLTVADYDATKGTIETSDGRTFVVGTTVALSTATSWDQYRSNVHYRCSQSGSCTLSRTGVVAPDARLI